MKDLEGRTALVTGASSGIGLATARLLTKRGARVGLMARRAVIISEIAQTLPGSIPIVADVADDESVSEGVSCAWEKLNSIDYLVHAAGVVTPEPLEELTPDLWRRLIDVNLSGAFYVMRACGLMMRKRGQGSIVTIGSELGLFGLARYSHYCASKAGLVGLTKALALELAPTVRVNCVCPGGVDTPMMDAELQLSDNPTETLKGLMSSIPLRRVGTADEVAKFITFVATEADYATGSILSIDGGTTAR